MYNMGYISGGVFMNNNNSIDKTLSRIFFYYCTQEEDRIKRDGIDFAYYSNLETIFSLLKNKEIWLRNVRCMNDYGELEFGYNVLRKNIYENKDKYNELLIALKSIKKFADRFWEDFFEIFWNIGFKNILKKETYIMCFTEHNPQVDYNGRLEMFNSYGRSNGSCIVLDGRTLVDEGILFSKVVYINDYDDNKLKDAIDGLIVSLKSNRKFLSCIDDYTLKFYMERAMLYAIISIKHNGFSYEKEWRLVTLKSENIHNECRFDPECVGGIPQMVCKAKIDKYRNLFKTVIIENKYEADVEKESLEEILGKSGYNKCKVHISDIPIRR